MSSSEISSSVADYTPYAISTGDTAWVLCCTTLVLFMTPGLGFFYAGGAVSPHNILHTIMSSIVAIALVAVQWYFWGYTLAFSPTGGRFIGDMKWIGLHGVNTGAPHPMAPHIPNMAYCVFEGMFATVTPAIVFSGAAERIRMIPYMIFVVVWSTLVYDPIAYWSWAQNGWFRKMGGLDYAGGLPVEVASGFATLGLAWAIGPRRHKEVPVNNAPFVILGASILWFGWLGFNAGSGLKADARAGAAIMNTNFIACIAGGVWMVCHWAYTKKWSTIALCTGSVAGLAAATPAAGYIDIHSCLAFGVVSGLVGWAFATFFDKLLHVDDTFMAFACHGVGGAIGVLLTGIFADKDIIALDGTCTLKHHIPLCKPGGWVNHHYIQLAYQLAGFLAAAVWSFFVTYVIVSVMLRARVIRPDEEEQEGLDLKLLGEEGYSFIQKSVHKAIAEASSNEASAGTPEPPSRISVDSVVVKTVTDLDPK